MVNSYVALDIETTGLSPKEDKILEIGAVRVINGEVVENYCTFVDPKTCIPENITALTGITELDVKGQKEDKQAVGELIEFCKDNILLGHNIIFDYSFIKRCAVNNKMSFDKMGIDTLKIAKALLPNLEKRNLTYLTRYYGIEQEGHHRAFSDAISASLLYQKLQEEFCVDNERVFEPFNLVYKPKKESLITPRQVKFLKDLIAKYNITVKKKVENMTKNEASRMIDKILSGQLR